LPSNISDKLKTIKKKDKKYLIFQKKTILWDKKPLQLQNNTYFCASTSDYKNEQLQK